MAAGYNETSDIGEAMWDQSSRDLAKLKAEREAFETVGTDRKPPIPEQLDFLSEGFGYLDDLIDELERRISPALARQLEAGEKSRNDAEEVSIHSSLTENLESLNNNLRRKVGRLQDIIRRIEL